MTQYFPIDTETPEVTVMFGKITILASVPMGLALLAGALIPLQASSNGVLGP
jgi:hypothetical protein